MRVYQVLRTGLLEGQYAPGQRMILQDLADQIGTSITPVREACLRLVSEGALEYKSGRFAQVPELTKDRYRSVILVRTPLEELAARLAAERISPQELQTLKEVNETYQSSRLPEQRGAAYRSNIEFHFGVYKASREETLVSHIEQLWVMMGPMLSRYFEGAIETYRGDDVHDKVIDALARRDSDAAEKWISADIDQGRNAFLQTLEANAPDLEGQSVRR
ncbi:DNA-binding transcriptional regulator, GntR family [Aliiroseovarius crassostreae]|uniref:GntR family transcriptional regulator n=1 Tax=Aliiroseovarius crassostreae TaxID=154981 RepID=UPI0008EE7C7B|nr:GntR family transcriptional regulator [Aliiroseovarius crassostreae]SFU71199.1 DNA-binding transcriptional regulator, GntR family [Aliiroseovarius crassostreae]